MSATCPALEALATQDLSLTPGRVLVYLTAGEANARELARHCGLNPATLTGTLDKLEARHLIETWRDLDDRRLRKAKLTQAGLAVARYILDPRPLAP